jgi:L-aspartate oxidase
VDDLIQTEVLIIGAGIAGGTAALQLAEAGVPVTVVTRGREPSDSNTYYAQGGLVYRGENDSAALLARDIENAGAGHCNPHAVAILSVEGPPLVEKILIDKLAVQFDREPDARWSLALEGGHSVPRILHAADATGRAVELALLKALRANPNVTLLAGHTAIDLLTPSHQSLNRLVIYNPQSCVGAYLLDQANDRVLRCVAKKTVLATGGLGQIFLRTTNPSGARGDGLAMAYRAGARVINAEFVQFHPTTFYRPPAPLFLISEAVRGAGARLVHANGEPFMQNYDPQWKDLAPRDVVARSIHHEMLTHDVTHVYLDLGRYLSKDDILAHFPNIHRDCLTYGVDITRDLVPVVPAAHYSCGGVWVDEWGQTTIDNLFAIGEVACTGVHGANRLASTSLLEGLVWGEHAARHIRGCIGEALAPNPANIALWVDAGSEKPDPALIAQDMSSVKHMMWNYVGLVRTTPRLARALHDLRELESEIEQFYRQTHVTDGLIGLRNAVRSAVIVATAAWENKASLGSHYRE